MSINDRKNLKVDCDVAKRRTRLLQHLNDWIVAPLGAASFVIASYWTMALVDIVPDLVEVTKRYGLSWSAVAGYLIVGGLSLTVWFHGSLAKRCNEIIYTRHFR